MKDLDKYYETVKNVITEAECEPAKEDCRKAYNRLYNALEAYILTIQDDAMRRAFKYGYKQGLKDTAAESK